MKGFSLRMARKKIISKTKAKKLLEMIDNLEVMPSGNLKHIDLADIKVAAMSVTAKTYSGLFDYIADMNAYVQKAREEGAQLVVFPEYTGMLILSALPVWKPLSRELAAAQDLEEALGMIADVMEELSGVIGDVYLTIFSELARLHDIYILGGSILCMEEDRLYNRATLFDRYGYMVLTQDKIFLSALERKMGLASGRETAVADTEIGSMAVLVGDDAKYFEVADIAARKGARLLLNCDLALGPYNPYAAQVGLEMRVQEARAYGVKSVMVGEMPFETKLYAKSGIYAPFLSTNDLSGVLAQADSYMHDAVLTESIDYARLAYAEDIYTHDTNEGLLRKNAPKCYQVLSMAPPQVGAALVGSQPPAAEEEPLPEEASEEEKEPVENEASL